MSQATKKKQLKAIKERKLATKRAARKRQKAAKAARIAAQSPEYTAMEAELKAAVAS